MNPYYRQPKQTLSSLSISAGLTMVLTLAVGCGQAKNITSLETSSHLTSPCEHGAALSLVCGEDLKGMQNLICDNGIWDESAPCVEPQPCMEGEIRSMNCGVANGGIQFEVCSLGAWSVNGSCVGITDSLPNDSETSPDTAEEIASNSTIDSGKLPPLPRN